MHLVLNHVAEFQHVGHTHRSLLLECLTRTTVVQSGLAVTGKPCFVGPLVQVVQRGTVEDRSSKLHSQILTGTSQNSLEYLTDVHT